MCDILRPYLEEVEAEDFSPKLKRRKLLEEDHPEEEEVLDPFVIYKSKGFAKTKLLLKAEGIHKKHRRFLLNYYFLIFFLYKKHRRLFDYFLPIYIFLKLSRHSKQSKIKFQNFLNKVFRLLNVKQFLERPLFISPIIKYCSFKKFSKRKITILQSFQVLQSRGGQIFGLESSRKSFGRKSDRLRSLRRSRSLLQKR